MAKASFQAFARNNKIKYMQLMTIDILLTRYAISTSNISTLPIKIQSTDVTMLCTLTQTHFGVSNFRPTIPSNCIIMDSILCSRENQS